MGLFYKAPPKKFLEIRSGIFEEYGVPGLKKNGFEQSPYNGMRFGKLQPSIYAYDLCRLSAGSHLETITVYISKGDRWIQISLNIFKLDPALQSLDQLKGLELMQFLLPPNSITQMRLRMYDYKGMPLFRTVEHKVKSYYSKRGFEKRIDQLSKLIERDMNNIDHFVKRWHELHQPATTDWEGNRLETTD